MSWSYKLKFKITNSDFVFLELNSISNDFLFLLFLTWPDISFASLQAYFANCFSPLINKFAFVFSKPVFCTQQMSIRVSIPPKKLLNWKWPHTVRGAGKKKLKKPFPMVIRDKNKSNSLYSQRKSNFQIGT